MTEGQDPARLPDLRVGDYITRGGHYAQVTAGSVDSAGNTVWYGEIQCVGPHAWYDHGTSPMHHRYDLVATLRDEDEEEETMSEDVQIGDIVHASFENEHKRHVCRPAIVVRRWSAEHDTPVQLQVFTDGGNDGPMFATGLFQMTSAKHRPVGERGWHFANECDGRL